MKSMAKAKPTPPDPSPDANPWPARLKKLRASLGLTKEQAAAKVRVSRRAWAKWEDGDQVPSPPLQLLIDLLEQEKF